MTMLLMGKSTISMAIFHCYLYVHQRVPYFFFDQCHPADGQTEDYIPCCNFASESLLLDATVPDLHGMCFSFTASHGSIVGGFKHIFLSIIYGIILPIDELIFFKMAKATKQFFSFTASHGSVVFQ